jgi:hypothetical protein
MQHSSRQFKAPPVILNAQGVPRSVGFELEFSGLTLDQTAEAVQRALGGAVTARTAATREISTPAAGDFTVELDWAFLKREAAADAQAEKHNVWLDRLSDAAAVLVPIEVVCPPLPITDLDRLDDLVGALRDAGAIGTEESLIAAYGVHINAEIPRLDAKTLHAYLRAFALLQWWLVKAHAVDPARDLSPYIALYPEAYAKLLLTQTAPSLDQLAGDYLEHNPSRNHALDLLPLLAELDADRVWRATNDDKIKARPAFHYRLPNCNIEHPDWSLAQSWNVWRVVETLADSEDDLQALGAAFLAADLPILGVRRGAWIKHVDQWLTDRALA